MFELFQMEPQMGDLGVEVVWVLDERRLDTKFGQRVVKQVVRSPVERGGGDHVPPIFSEIENGERLGTGA